jgi:GNAT superfamily N-acetyltransferase
MPISIRKATESDFSSVLMLVKELAVFQQMPHKVENTVEQMKADKDLFHCFVAENEHGEIIGIATYFFAWYSWVGKSLYLDDLCVKETERGKSAGRKLLNKIIDTAKQEGCKRVRWQVSDWNTRALAFYENCGAVIDKEVFNCDVEGEALSAWQAGND